MITNIVTMYKYIKDLLTSKNFNDQVVLNLYIPVIYYDNKEAFITKPNKLPHKSNTPNTYTYTEDINLAATFTNKNEIQTLIELKGLDYTIVQFKDLFTKAYTIALGNDKTNGDAKIITHTSWKPINYYQEESNIVTTTDPALAQTKLNLYKYRLVKTLQNKIIAVATVQLN